MFTPQDTILAFGDSITYGYGVHTSQSYPSVLASLLNRKVINAGVNGDTSEDGLSRLPNLLQDTSIKLILLCFGGNDILQQKSLSSLKANLKTMIQIAKEQNIHILLISVPNFSAFGLSPLALYKDIAREENIPLLNDTLTDILSNPNYKIDQIHPNASGYKIMSEKIYEKLEETTFE
ncbi:MAG: arylesterase [Sulfurovum sp.]|nr:MAG: arylesterase [Sulfurovum sp.]